MKLRRQLSILANVIIPIVLSGIGISPVHAQTGAKVLFYCGKSSQGDFTTYAKTPRGRVPIITWKATVGDSYDPQTRCRLVSERFQGFHNNGNLRFLTTGKINRQNVVCVATAPGQSCMPDGLLFTVTQTANASSILKQLARINIQAGGGNTISETTCPFSQELGEQFYFNVDCYLNDPASIETVGSN